jgi:ABC-2 type transport system ATP-binding protein
MVDWAAAGKTVFLSSHQIGEVERVADIVAILHNGKLVLVEPLERLKSQICELTITLHDGSTDLPPVAGEVLRQHRKARQWQLLVRNLRHDDLPALQNHPSIQSLEVRTPSLEEIFVAYMQRDRASGATGDGLVAEEVPAP